jgi:hypothetical protein
LRSSGCLPTFTAEKDPAQGNRRAVISKDSHSSFGAMLKAEVATHPSRLQGYQFAQRASIAAFETPERVSFWLRGWTWGGWV